MTCSFEDNYRKVLEAVKATGAKITMIEPFIVSEDKLFFYEDLFPKILIIRKLAREYADAYLPLDGYVASKWASGYAEDISNDGVHPNESGREFIGKLYCEYISPIIESHKTE